MSRRRLAESLVCAFVLAVLTLTGASCRAPNVADTAGATVGTGDLALPASDTEAMATLLAMTQQMSVAEISENIKTTVQPLESLLSANPAAWRTIVERPAVTGKPVLAVDSAGTLHIVFSEHFLVPEVDHNGNRNRWISRLYHCRRTGDRWTEPAALPEAEIYAEVERVLFTGDGTMLLLATGYNNTPTPTAQGVKPGQHQILLYRLPLGGAWSQPEYCLDEHSSLHFDACFDAEGRLHLVAEDKTSKPRALRHRVLDGGTWREEAIAGLADRNMSYPRLRLVGGRLHVICSGQGVWPDSNRIGTYHQVRDDAGRWSAPELLADGTAFETAAAPAARGLVAVAETNGSASEPRRLALFRADPGGRFRPAVAMVPLGRSRTQLFDLATMDVGPDGRAYVPGVLCGALIVVRESADGRGEACLLARPTDAEQRIRDSHLEFRDGRLLVSWAVIDASGPDTWALRFWESPVPREGWLPLAELVWRMQGGVGLDGWLRRRMQAEILAQARAADEEFDMPRAVERYLYYLANFDGWDDAARYRLQKLDWAGVLEVRRQLWALRLKDRTVVYNEYTAIGALMKSLLIKPSGKGAERILSLPVQDRETVRRLITEYEEEQVVVFLSGGKEAVIRPDLAKVDEVSMRHCFATACVRALDGAKAEGLGELELAWESPDLCTYVTPPRTRFRLRELATWEIRPQHTDRWTYLVDLYDRELCTEQPLKEIVEGVEHVLPILLARIAGEPYYRESGRRTRLLGYLIRQPASRERVLARLLPLAASKNDNERGWAINALSQGGRYGPEYLRRMVPWIRDETDDDIRHLLLLWLSHQLKRNDCRDLLKEDAVLRTELVTEVSKLEASADRDVRLYVGICLKAMPPAPATQSP